MAAPFIACMAVADLVLCCSDWKGRSGWSASCESHGFGADLVADMALLGHAGACLRACIACMRGACACTHSGGARRGLGRMRLREGASHLSHASPCA
jgi:hypothetical protein